MFTRLVIDANGETTVIDYLTPASIKAPYVASRGTKTIVHDLLQSEANRVTHLPASSRTGIFAAVFATQEDASAALDWFTGPYLYLLTKYGASAAETLFAVAGGSLQITQNLDGSWELSIPYREVIE
jgi:hypothetical protein